MYNQSVYNHNPYKDLTLSDSDKKLEERDGLNFYNARRDLDYSMNSDTTLDSRVLKVCQEAENNFLENQRAIKEIQKLKNMDFKYRFSSNRYEDNYDNKEIRENRDINYSTISKGRPSGVSEISHSPLVTFSNNSNNTHRDSNSKRNYLEKEIFEKERVGKIVNFDKYFNNNYSNENHILNLKNTGRSLSSLKISNTNKNSDKNNLQVHEVSNSSSISNKYKIPIKHKHLKSGKRCIACELKKR
jgi:hypothetical protein